MEKEIIALLSKEVVEKFSSLNIQDEMAEFLQTSIETENKLKALELLYLCQLYSNAYLGPDPRFKAKNLHSNINAVLTAKNNEDFNTAMTRLREFVEQLKSAEVNPLSTAKRKIEDKEKYSNVMW